MSDPLRAPVLTHRPLPVPKRAQAALNAACLWLNQSGELQRIYEVWPDFPQRSTAVHKLLTARLASHLLTRQGSQTKINFACHCHPNIVSIALQVEDEGGETGFADVVIPLRLFYSEGFD